ncbi:MAG: T9SS type A sorting domain-containing protein [Saprospiraceae bacterium]|nr:T9SS type A sorting domain-containing protein [Saprospiraceae bacterium]
MKNLRFYSALLCGVLGILLYPLKLNAQDNLPPEIICKTGMVVVLPVTGEVVVDARSFDDGTTDNVTAQEDLIFYLNDNPAFTSYRVTCDSFDKKGVLGEYRETLYLHVEDEAGNVSVCQVDLIVQDNKYICGRPSFNCTGCIKNWYNDELVEARLNCQDDTSACYSIEVTQPTSLSFCRDWDPLNGVSTSDIVYIQRHLLGLQEFDHRLLYVAADVNNTQSVSAGDISTLRKLILGLISDFSPYNLPSWLILHREDSLNYNSEIFFDTIRCPENTDLTAVKIGDISGPVRGGLKEAQTRNSLDLIIESSAISGKEVHTFSLGENISIAGMELILELNDENVIIEPGLLDIGDKHYSIVGSELRLSWTVNDAWSLHILERATLFSVTGRFTDDLSARLVRGEVYDEQVNTIYLKQIPEKRPPVLFPNPAKRGETVQFFQKGHGQDIELYDSSGRLIRSWRQIPRLLSIQTHDLKSGLYFIKASDVEAEYIEKLIVH